ncbi:SH3 domain-containing protein [Hymenobacter latericus]|uniref:SH3 domain-containing protein n=1 Tax=Hymenobacter sp. YIM 151858-1 TaxID=2987688 RepID=UPI002225C298|nr:SH3 domain-containing protein [Hymenobacter sp. YIM 151858-1]UYZ58013.1 SH3 domain-containing protein [Hymenobacter sp. YIM 151858-1]
MNRLLFAALLLSLGACATAKDDVAKIPTLLPVAIDRTTGTTCGLYSQASTQSEMLAMVEVGAKIQVLDSSNAHFVRARLSKNGKAVTGFMYKACLGK